MTVDIRVRLWSRHSKGSMLGSNMEEISVQTRRREIEPTTRGKDMEKGMRDLKEQMQDLREGMLVSQVQLVSHEEVLFFHKKVLSMLASMESRMEALATRIESWNQQVKQELAIYKAAVSTQAMATQEASRVKVLKPQGFSGKRDAKELDNFLWRMEWYFKAIALTNEPTKVRTTTLYLTDTATLWWS